MLATFRFEGALLAPFAMRLCILSLLANKIDHNTKCGNSHCLDNRSDVSELQEGKSLKKSAKYGANDFSIVPSTPRLFKIAFSRGSRVAPEAPLKYNFLRL